MGIRIPEIARNLGVHLPQADILDRESLIASNYLSKLDSYCEKVYVKLNYLNKFWVAWLFNRTLS